MNVRLVGGKYGGRSIRTSKSKKTHPMSTQVRGSLFNILGDLAGQSVLDTFAGSGALGLESLSRGANQVTFIESDRAAQNVISENIDLLKVSRVTKLIKSTIFSWHQTSESVQFDLILADPPYHNLQLSTVSLLTNHLKPMGLMVLSHPGRESAPTVNGVVVVDKRSYGDAALAFYRLETYSQTA